MFYINIMYSKKKTIDYINKYACANIIKILACARWFVFGSFRYSTCNVGSSIDTSTAEHQTRLGNA